MAMKGILLSSSIHTVHHSSQDKTDVRAGLRTPCVPVSLPSCRPSKGYLCFVQVRQETAERERAAAEAKVCITHAGQGCQAQETVKCQACLVHSLARSEWVSRGKQNVQAPVLLDKKGSPGQLDQHRQGGRTRGQPRSPLVHKGVLAPHAVLLEPGLEQIFRAGKIMWTFSLCGGFSLSAVICLWRPWSP